ncbi:hypothetical protein [Streptomyces chryseus]|uniref:hypothetical protein n=1 Tax=Streptomyces chryseus TaxID=68186 RepID=UPI00110FB7D8|nr:hypothetical protein [Streptomyces chryseus]GGX41250.1 hypothetical protein GCM10010353_65700 [Streptomyces chryseus]
MPWDKESPKKARKALHRQLKRIEARFPSRHDGITFHAVISVQVHAEPPYPLDVGELATEIRISARDAASLFLRDQEAVDLAAVQDLASRHLRGQRPLPADPSITYSASIKIVLSAEDQAAVAALVATRRSQAIEDARSRQRTDAAAAQYAHPAAILARWLEAEAVDWDRPPSEKDLSSICQAFAQYRPEGTRDTEYELLEILRGFLSTFSAPTQKEMLCTVLAAGMRGAHRPQHAEQVEALLDRPAQRVTGPA